MQNLTIDNIYTFASITSINLIILTSTCIYLTNIVLKLSTFIAIFLSVLRCYLNNIFYNRLNIKNIIRFTTNLFFVVATNIIDFFNTRSLLNLLCAFDIYIFIVLSFVLHLTIK